MLFANCVYRLATQADCQALLSTLGVAKAQYQVGVTKVFLKKGTTTSIGAGPPVTERILYFLQPRVSGW